MLTALAHDFVLRRNIRVSTTGCDAPPNAFTRSAFSSHHVQLVNANARTWNALLEKQKSMSPTAVTVLQLLPELPDVASQESFGCVTSHHAASFGGLLEVKSESEDEAIDFGSNSYSSSSIEDIAQDLNIAPLLLFTPPTAQVQPQANSASTSHPLKKSITPDNSAYSRDSVPKRRLTEVEAETSAVKKTRTVWKLPPSFEFTALTVFAGQHSLSCTYQSPAELVFPTQTVSHAISQCTFCTAPHPCWLEQKPHSLSALFRSRHWHSSFGTHDLLQ
jgi:hypothetical protein